MKKNLWILIIVIILLLGTLITYNYLNKDSEKIQPKEKGKTSVTTTTKKDEEKENMMDKITLNYHASIRMEKSNKVIYFDPFKIDNASSDADYIFITHSHYDHYSEADIKKVMKDDTKFIVTSDLENKVTSLGVSKDNITVVYPNEKYDIDDIKFDTIPSYNTNKTYHKKSYNWVGYNVLIDGVKYYVVGDSDSTEELQKVDCDVIFIPVGGTYTMTDSEAIEVVNEMKPKYAVPIHYGEVGSSNNAENFINGLSEDIKGVILK